MKSVFAGHPQWATSGLKKRSLQTLSNRWSITAKPAFIFPCAAQTEAHACDWAASNDRVATPSGVRLQGRLDGQQLPGLQSVSWLPPQQHQLFNYGLHVISKCWTTLCATLQPPCDSNKSCRSSFISGRSCCCCLVFIPHFCRLRSSHRPVVFGPGCKCAGTSVRGGWWSSRCVCCQVSCVRLSLKRAKKTKQNCLLLDWRRVRTLQDCLIKVGLRTRR